MRAIGLNDFGDVSNFQITTLKKPVCFPNQVLIKTQAIGLNPVDYKTRAGGGVRPSLSDEEVADKPIILGWDIAGIVEEVGVRVRSFKPGDNVMGMAGFPKLGKAYAEYVAVDADELVAIPDNISFSEAAAFPLAALTAYEALFDFGFLRPNSTVLIHGAAGGVGHLAVQMALNMGAVVIGTASGSKLDQLIELGVNQVIDYEEYDFTRIVKDASLVFDTVGGEVTARSLKVVRPGGKLVTILPGSLTNKLKKYAKDHHIDAKELLVYQSPRNLERIAEMIECDHLKVRIDREFTFDQIVEAHTYLESGQANGKVVVVL